MRFLKLCTLLTTWSHLAITKKIGSDCEGLTVECCDWSELGLAQLLDAVIG